MFTKPELDPLLINCQYTEETKTYDPNFNYYRRELFLTNPISKTQYVKRYISEEHPLPEGMIDDNVSSHLQRSFCYLVTIFTYIDGETDREIYNEIDKEYAILMLLLHDLGELRALSDVSVIDKKDTAKEEYEHFLKEMDKLITTKDDIEYKKQCYNEFNNARLFLMGKEGNTKPAEKIGPSFNTALLVRTIDIIDGNLYFHKKLRAWIENGNEFPDNHSSISYAFKQKEIYLQQLKKLPDSNTKALLKRLMDNMTKNIENMWENDKDIMPDSLYNKLYGKPRAIPFFPPPKTVSLEDYKHVDFKKYPSLVILFHNVFNYLSLDNKLVYPSKYFSLSNKSGSSFVLETEGEEKSQLYILVRKGGELNKEEVEFTEEYRREIKKHGCIRTPTYGKLERQYFSLTEEGEPCTFGIASIKDNK